MNMGISRHMNPRVRPAAHRDIPELLKLFQEVREWAMKRGYQQTIDTCTPEELKVQIEGGSVYVCEDEEPGIVASFTLLDVPKAGLTEWVEAFAFAPEFTIDSQNMLCLKRLAVACRRAGEGLGYCVLDKACEIVRKRGKSILSLDCWAGNTKLRSYYICAGFEFVGIARKKDDDDVRLAFFRRQC